MELGRRELDLSEVRLVHERQIDRVEDRVEPIADLQLEGTSAVPVFIGHAAAEVAVLGVAEGWDGERNAVEGAARCERRL